MEFEVSDQLDSNGLIVDKIVKITRENVTSNIEILSLTEIKIKKDKIDAEIKELQNKSNELNLFIEGCK